MGFRNSNAVLDCMERKTKAMILTSEYVSESPEK